MQVIGLFPTLRPNSIAALKVASEVSGIRMTSSSFITGTGLKKCSPQNRSKRWVLLAISPIGIEEVLLEKIVDGFAT